MVVADIGAQTIETNLQKYWNYRERLRKYFVLISPNDEAGSNYPASSIDVVNKVMQWGDGNGSMQYYIGMLATEYALLQQSGLDVTQTRNELLYALKAVNRMDLNAEKYYRGALSSNDLNGLFLRDDVPSDLVSNTFKNAYPQLAGLGISSCFTSNYNRDPGKIGVDFLNSKDNVWHYLLNLALVAKLVNDPEINQMAKDIAYRMVYTMMHYCGGGFTTCWEIRNPGYNNQVITTGNKQVIDEPNGACETSPAGFRYGFSTAGEAVSGQSLWENCESGYFGREYHRSRFFSNMTPIVIGDPLWDNYSYLALASVAGEEDKFKSHTSGFSSIYDFLINNRDDNPFNPVRPYEHFPLIYEILHGPLGNYDPTSQSEWNYYLNLLNSAPDCGTYNFGQTNYDGLPIRPFEWSSDNRLVWPENLGKDNNLDGSSKTEYRNGIDFMLLHNLFWLTYIQKSLYNYYNYSSFPQGAIGTYNNPVTLNIQNKIYEYGQVRVNGGVIDVAGSKILLKPGFMVENGGYYRGYITANWPNCIEFNILTPSLRCTINLNGSLKSALIENNESITPDSTNRHLSFKANTDDLSSNGKVVLYPNPTSNKVFVTGLSNFEVEVCELSGKKLISIAKANGSIDLTSLNPGIYMLQLKSEGKTYIQKIVKQ